MKEEYNVAEEIRSESKVAGKVFISDFAFLSVYYMMMYMLNIYVHGVLMLPYAVFVVVTGIVMTMPSPFNPKKKIYQSCIIYLRKNKTVYKPLKNYSVRKQMEILRKQAEVEYENKR